MPLQPGAAAEADLEACPAAGARPRLRFLGRDPAPPFLVRTARTLLEESRDLAGLAVALPGGRAGRLLEEALVEELRGPWTPPRLTTLGALTDVLLPARRRIASRAERELLWARALEGLDEDLRAALVPHPPSGEGWAVWLPWARALRGLHAELAPAGLDFQAVLDRLGNAPRAERRRWQALAAVQEAWRGLLEEAGAADPHEDRLARLRDPQWAPEIEGVVIVGAAEIPPLTRRVLQAWAAGGRRLEAWIQAPEEEGPDLDAWGTPRPEAWAERPLDLSPEAWEVLPGPGELARQAAATLARWRTERPPEEITLGLADPGLLRLLEAAAEAVRLPLHRPGGRPLVEHPWLRLLEAAARFLEGRRTEAAAALLRHPLLAAEAPGRDLEERSARAGLARLAEGPQALPGDPRLREACEHLEKRLRGLPRRSAPLSEQVRALGSWLRSRLPDRPLAPGEPDAEAARLLARRLEILTEAARRAGDPEAEPARAAAWILEELRSQALGEPSPPDAVEALGWLELALDPAPALLLCGLDEGAVPARRPQTPFLGEALRRRLGLPGPEERAARDRFLLEALRGRPLLRILCSRRNAEGERRLPSRLLLQGGGRTTAERLERALRETPAPRRPPGEGSVWTPPVLGDWTLPDRLRVTAFRDWLRSPYLFYLRHVEKLETWAPGAGELEPMLFGTLAHAVLEELRDPKVAALPAGELSAFLQERLDRAAARHLGRERSPAVELQLLHLRLRLERLAHRQAEVHGEGWRVHQVEWSPGEEGRPLEVVNGEAVRLTGRVDRIDLHPVRGCWRILDYKTGDKPTEAKAARRRDGSWKDLQLPLYAWMWREHLRETGHEGRDWPIQLAWWNLPADPAKPDLAFLEPASGESEEEFVQSALDCAAEAVRAMRATDGGVFQELGDFPDREPVLAALAGLGLTGASTEEENGEEEG